MPRVSRKQAELNREIIVEAATRLFRERGIHGISVSDVMAAAGLTHGGFYGHFESREALATEACNRAFEQSSERWQARVEQSPDPEAARLALIDPYLSAANRDTPGTVARLRLLPGRYAMKPPTARCNAALSGALKRPWASWPLPRPPEPPKVTGRPPLPSTR